jgi:aromatic-amino-acid transaminase
MSGHFASIPIATKDPIFGLNSAFAADARSEKINLGMGVYCTAALATPVLSCVKEAEKIILQTETTKKYLPIRGDEEYLESSATLVLGEDLYERFKERLTLVQSIGGSGALHLGGDFLSNHVASSIYISDPSWVNHEAIFSLSRLKVLSYPYYDFEKKELNFARFVDYLENLSSKSIVLFHVVCHNPSGADLTRAQWQEVAEICKERRLIPFFDAAYLGFDKTIAEDAYPIRLFMQEEVEFLLAVSFSKNMSLYAERTGFFLIFSDLESCKPIDSQIKSLVRRNYSSPPLHGANVVSTILRTPSIRAQWEEELFLMKSRINKMRSHFEKALTNKEHDYSYLLNKKGFFSYCALTKEQVNILVQDYAIYLPCDGRVNLAGLNDEAISLVVKAFRAVGG